MGQNKKELHQHQRKFFSENGPNYWNSNKKYCWRWNITRVSGNPRTVFKVSTKTLNTRTKSVYKFNLSKFKKKKKKKNITNDTEFLPVIVFSIICDFVLLFCVNVAGF